jgi:1-acyl-sn-glycerol-3-phosphate acyltransferase
LLDLLRTLAALAAILPGLVAGGLVALLGGDRRRAFNRATELWGELGTRAAGIDLRVTGAEFLDVRPAVFVINHQSGIDPILVCALLRRNFVGVAKAEIRRNPVLGPAFALAGTIFLDRGDGPAARRSLAAGLEKLRQGLGVAIAPEGTRSPGARIGRFKSGAFRLAVEARVPVVPIVIHDAGRVLPRGGLIMRAGPVHVSVQPPIPTSDWSLETLRAHVDGVEAVFNALLSEAGQPPVA